MTDDPRPEPQLPSGVPAPDGLVEAFWAYETALMADDLAALERLFADAPGTLRGDAAGLLVGHGAISAFRAGRGGAPARRITALHIRPIGDGAATVVALTRTPGGGRGQQTQTWRRDADAGWVVDVAHVAAPAPAIDARVWRVVGAPLVPATASGAPGPLDGGTVAVKDLFAIEGQRIGAGLRARLREAPVETRTASAVRRLLDAGAGVTGIAQTDQLAYSIAGTNPDYGVPPNPAVIGGIPGGSSSGPASAVALGQVTVGLGTDTGGSIRVPASYQGLWGLRTTHGAVARDGLLPLAPSFDTVGWLARNARTLAAVASAGLDEGRGALPLHGGFVVAPATLTVVEPGVRTAAERAIAELDARTVDVGDLDALFETFRTVQAVEARREHGDWVTAHPGALAADVAGRFAWAATLDADDERRERAALADARTRIRDALGDAVLLLPSASSVAPQTTAGRAELDRVRSATLRLTAIAGAAGLPALSAPVLDLDGAPVGLCFVGPADSDLALIELATSTIAR